MHVIWGKIEDLSDSTDTNNSRHPSHPSSEGEALKARAEVSPHQALFCRTWQQAKAQHVTHILFQERSSSSASTSSKNPAEGNQNMQSSHRSPFGVEQQFQQCCSEVGLIEETRVANAPVNGGDDVDDEDEDDLLSGEENIAADDPRWSVGAARHSTGQCRPCRFARALAGCVNGRDCSFCHLDHTKGRSRPSKSKRLKCKKFLRYLESLSDKDPERFKEALGKVTTQSSYLQGMLSKKLEHVEAAQGSGSASSSGIQRIMSL